MARCLGQRLGWPEEKITFEALMKPEVREKLGELTFVTATDGNHGRGVAWAARQLGHKSVVYMPKAAPGSGWTISGPRGPRRRSPT